jgi:pimeloyl-ACP methyl ester carboxylesterase
MKLRVPGASLHYEVRGTGPVLIISQSGEGDADRTVDLVGHLADSHTVVTYDRRGLSRSTIDDPTRPLEITDHADDVHHLLAEVTDAPALMLGCSLGAVIGLHVAVRHPGLLRTLVAHEPVAPWLLPADERAHHVRELLDVRQTYRTSGLTVAMKEVAEVLGIDPTTTDVEPDRTPQPMTPQRIANFDFFLTHEFTAIARDDGRPADVAAVSGTRIVPAVGRTTPRTVFDHRCAQELSHLVGTEVAEFPGGHNGNLSHPKAYAARLREVLGSYG